MAALPSSSLPGHKLLAERANTALDTCVERQDVEFMESQPWKDLKLGIVKTVLGMGNLRDGGIIIIGVSQRDEAWEPKGVNQSELATYDENRINDEVGKFVSPNADLTIVTHAKEGKTFLVIHVAPFRDTPLVCKRDHGKELHAGTVYVRPPGKAETRTVLNALEMEQLLERAVEIRVRQRIEQLQRLGLIPLSIEQQRFEQEREGL